MSPTRTRGIQIEQIRPHPLWIGHAGDGTDYRRLLDLSIEAIVQLAVEEPPLRPPRSLIYVRFPLIDGEGNGADLMALALENVVNLIRSRVPTLVCCGAGMSRSPAVVAAALALVEQKSAESALRYVTKGRRADVSPALWADILKTCRMGDTHR